METHFFWDSNWSFYIWKFRKIQHLVSNLVGISLFWEALFTFRDLISLITSLELVSLKVKFASKLLLFIFVILRWFSKIIIWVTWYEWLGRGIPCTKSGVTRKCFICWVIRGYIYVQQRRKYSISNWCFIVLFALRLVLGKVSLKTYSN